MVWLFVVLVVRSSATSLLGLWLVGGRVVNRIGLTSARSWTVRGVVMVSCSVMIVLKSRLTRLIGWLTVVFIRCVVAAAKLGSLAGD